MKYQELGKGVVRRREKKKLGLFIDGIGLDRATRRINRKVDISSLIRGVSAGLNPVVARYYTLIPYEDDSRQRAYLDAIERAGISVVVKRLPPKNISRQVSIDVEMATDMAAFALGSESLGAGLFGGSDYDAPQIEANTKLSLNPTDKNANETTANFSKKEDGAESRLITVICPSRELSYTLGFIRSIGACTTTADFGQFSSHELMKLSSKWIDLSDSETIWRD